MLRKSIDGCLGILLARAHSKPSSSRCHGVPASGAPLPPQRLGVSAVGSWLRLPSAATRWTRTRAKGEKTDHNTCHTHLGESDRNANPHEASWAHLGSNQGPPACETGSALRRCPPASPRAPGYAAIRARLDMSASPLFAVAAFHSFSTAAVGAWVVVPGLPLLPAPSSVLALLISSALGAPPHRCVERTLGFVFRLDRREKVGLPARTSRPGTVRAGLPSIRRSRSRGRGGLRTPTGRVSICARSRGESVQG
jgi:hypothetical protein